MKWIYRIIQLRDGSYATQCKVKGFWSFLEGWSVAHPFESYLDAQAHCKRMIQLDREREEMKANKKFKIIEIFE